jgi:hypothetical protein
VTPLRLVDVQQLIEFRLKGRNEQARQDYLAEVAEHVRRNDRTDLGDKDRADRAQERVSDDMQLAATSLRKRFGRAGLMVGFGAATAIVPMMDNLSSTSEWVGGAAALGVTGIAASKDLRLRHPHRYLRAANRAALLPQT